MLVLTGCAPLSAARHDDLPIFEPVLRRLSHFAIDVPLELIVPRPEFLVADYTSYMPVGTSYPRFRAKSSAVGIALHADSTRLTQINAPPVIVPLIFFIIFTPVLHYPATRPLLVFRPDTPRHYQPAQIIKGAVSDGLRSTVRVSTSVAEEM